MLRTLKSGGEVWLQAHPVVVTLALVLSRTELAHRLKAARELRGISQDKLAKQLEREGLGKHDLGKLERADDKMAFTAVRRYALATALRVPESWFIEENLDLVVGYQSPERSAERVEERLGEIEITQRAILGAMTTLEKRLGVPSTGHQTPAEHPAAPST